MVAMETSSHVDSHVYMKKNSHRNGIQAFLHNREYPMGKTFAFHVLWRSNVKLFKELTLALR